MAPRRCICHDTLLPLGRLCPRSPYARAVLRSIAQIAFSRRCRLRPAPTPPPEDLMGIISIIGIIIVGFLVGVLARFFYPGVVEMGFVMTTVLGIAGSFLGGLLSSVLFRSKDGNFHPAGWFLSIIGAIILIWVYLNYLK